MANTTPWWQQLGDTVGFPGVAAATYSGAKLMPSLARYGLGAATGLAAAPAAAAMTAASVMQPTSANAGEQPLYVKDAQGNWVPNMANPIVSAKLKGQQPPTPFQASGNNQPLSPMPAVAPWPLQQNGMNPTGNPPQPSAQPQPSPMTTTMAQGPAASVPLPTPRPQFANVPMPPPRPMAPPLSLAPPSPGPTAPPANLYSGPGSQNFGMGAVTGDNGSGTWSTQSPLMQRFLSALKFGHLSANANTDYGYAPQQQQQQQPLIPRMANDIGMLAKLF